MNDDVRERILGLLNAGPATVARLATRLKQPGGVVSYELKRLEQDGLVRVGASRTVQGVSVPAYVSTAAAAPPALSVPAPLPGLTWTGTGQFPVPLWTAPHPPSPAPEPEPSGHAATGSPPAPRGTAPAPASSGARTAPSLGALVPSQRGAADVPDDWSRGPQPTAWGDGSPRLMETRRVPMDDATLYEFAARLDALAREFAARATPGAPAVELNVMVHRPLRDQAAGYGS